MTLKPGSRWRSGSGSTEVVVVRAPKQEGAIECGGVPMTALDADAAAPIRGKANADEVNILLGKRYENGELGIEVLCTKAGSGPLSFDGEQLTEKGAKPLPSSD